MPVYFFDTSALVKRYHIEAGSEKVNELFDNPEGIFVITSIAVTEFVSALARKLYEGSYQKMIFAPVYQSLQKT